MAPPLSQRNHYGIDDQNVIYCDDQSAIALTHDPEHHARTKHIDILTGMQLINLRKFMGNSRRSRELEGFRVSGLKYGAQLRRKLWVGTDPDP